MVRRLAGRPVMLDGDGFFWDPDQWSEAAAEALARENRPTGLTPQHWRVLHFLREYFAHHGRAPLNRQLARGTGLRLLEMEGLFPGGIKYGARRLAGLPNPKTCM